MWRWVDVEVRLYVKDGALLYFTQPTGYGPYHPELLRYQTRGRIHRWIDEHNLEL